MSPARDDTAAQQLVTTEAAYLFASGEAKYHPGLSRLCREIVAAMQEHFGTFLLLELWEDRRPDEDGRGLPAAPGFQIMSPDVDTLPSTIEALTEALSQITIRGQAAHVRTRHSADVCPPKLPPLTDLCRASAGCCVIGLAVKPVYRDPESGAVYPLVLQRLRRQLAGAIRQTIAHFTGLETGSRNVHYDSLGPSTLVKAARIVDHQLCDVAESFDFLLQVTPINSDDAWDDFSAGGFREPPALLYRPLPYHPNLLKRRLFSIEIERIEDPTLAHLFWEKQDEVDIQLTALRELDTPHFLSISQQLYGAADDELTAQAREILETRWKEPTDTSDQTGRSFLNTQDVVQRGREEIDHYFERLKTFQATVEVSDQIASGIMVSHDRLLISSDLQLRAERLEPLMHHEVGTHLLTYFNGRSQPFRQLYSGLAGYDELQEGLAVLAEYLSGGLTVKRLRNLAARVIAVRSLTAGATFVDTFHHLREDFALSPRRAFVTTLRVYRGGGFTKDVIYLRGLRDLLTYLAAGHDIEPLYVGKIGLHHLPYVQELRRRGIIDAPCLLPRLWDQPGFSERLESCRGRSLLQLLEKHP